ncbi:MAG: DNA replication and repair protein RecF [Fimbriimonadaceae bacterium]|nr:DNA replication and repair protein RecF [Fimbriimonadaceae bacterium]
MRQLAMRQFRRIRELDLEVAPGFNVLVGANAQGKTTVLEGIALLGTTQVLRGRRDADAITSDCDEASVRGTLAESGTTLAMDLLRGARKRASLNGLGLPRPSDLLGRFPVTTVTTEDLRLVRGEPSDRRLFLDLELSALSSAYLRDFGQYKRALEQRNALLRRAREFFVPDEAFEPWEAMMAKAAETIREWRAEYVVSLEKAAQPVQMGMGQGESLNLQYEANDDARTETDFLRAWSSSRGLDLQRGGTSVGPHRDDWAIVVDGRDARYYGSQGQQRTAVIGIKIASLAVAAERLGFTPMLLLDDMLSDLDETRRARLVSVVRERAAQAMLTCTESALAGPELLRSAAVFSVHDGRVTAL